MKKLLIVLVVALVSAGCGGNSSTSTDKPVTAVVKVTEANAGQSVELDAGGTLEITLKSNATTGYHWEVMSVDSGILKQEGPPVYVSDPNPEQLVGSGGKTTFVFKALTQGQTDLKLNYTSPANVQSETSFSIIVKVGQ
ncbi:MAG: protease inhibitor I42 family protein [Thermoleophilia bacterium]|jgi:predicted secreted protein